MSAPKDIRPTIIDRFLDGSLSELERREFLLRVQQDAALRAEFEVQRALDASIRRQFAPPQCNLSTIAGLTSDPAPAPKTLSSTAGVPAAQSMPSRRTLWIGIAASVALLGAIAAILWLSSPASNTNSRSRIARGSATFTPEPPGDVYIRQLAKNFTPEWVCEDDHEFERSVIDRLGQPLLARADAGVDVLGWAYNAEGYDGSFGVLSANTMYLLTRVDGKPVVVLIDRLKNDRKLAAPDEQYIERFRAEFPDLGTLALFRREFDELVAYEITPLTEARVLDVLYVPERNCMP